MHQLRGLVMAKYLDCILTEKGVYTGVMPLEVTRFNFINRLWTSIVHPVLKPKIILTKTEAKKLGIKVSEGYITSVDGIRIPVTIK